MHSLCAAFWCGVKSRRANTTLNSLTHAHKQSDRTTKRQTDRRRQPSKFETFSFLRKTHIRGNAHKCSTKWKSISFKRWQNNKIKDAYAREICPLGGACTRPFDTFSLFRLGRNEGIVIATRSECVSWRETCPWEGGRRLPLRCLEMSLDLLDGAGAGGSLANLGWQFGRKREAIEIAPG